jgi:hypothetical protein
VDPRCPDPDPAPDGDIVVPKGGNLQQAIDDAPEGATIRVYPDTYDGIVLRGRTANLTIQPDTIALDALARVTPDHAPALIKLRPTLGGSSITTELRARGYRLIGVCPLPGDPGANMIGLGVNGCTVPDDLPGSIIVDRSLIVADPARGGKRGIMANVAGFACYRSYFDHFWYNADAQGICAWAGCGPFVIENNFIAATGENVLFGGSDAPAAEVMPADAVIRGNTLTKRLEWREVAEPTVKNTLEFKAIRRALVEGNVIEYAWVDGQNGTIVLFTPRNQGGGAPWSEVADITFRWNVVRHAAGGLNILGQDYPNASGVTHNLTITDNLFDDISPTWGNNGRLIIMNAGAAYTFARNTGAVGLTNSFLSLDGQPVEGLTFTDNIVPEGAYGIIGTSQAPGTPSWDAFIHNGVFERNVIQRTSATGITYPGSTNVITPPNESAIGADYRPLPAYAGRGVNVDELRRRVGGAI